MKVTIYFDIETEKALDSLCKYYGDNRSFTVKRSIMENYKRLEDTLKSMEKKGDIL